MKASHSPVAQSVPFTDTLFTADNVLDAVKEVRQRSELRLDVGAQNYTPSYTNLSNGGTLSLTSSSACLQFLQGSGTGFNVKLPDASTLLPGRHFIIANHTSFVVVINDGAGNFLFNLSQESIAYVYLQADSTPAGYWMYFQILASSTASGIINYNLTADTTFTTNSITDVQIPMFALTPQAGTYAVWYNADSIITQNNAKSHCSIYKNDLQLVDSERSQQGMSSNYEIQTSTMTVVECNGTDIITVRVRISSNSVSIFGRSLLLIRLGS